jgi:hypothetical protein
MLRTHTDPAAINIFTPESRSALAKMVTKLFQYWKISTADQLELLGLSAKSRSMLTRYRNGEALPESRDTLDRVGWIMSIHKGLGLLYPYNEDVRYSWVNRRNKAFDNLAPLDVMREHGIIGIARVARYIDFYRGH